MAYNHYLRKKEAIEQALTEIRGRTTNEEVIESLGRIEKQISFQLAFQKWFMRLAFGFRLANSIETWKTGLEEAQNSQFTERLPLQETEQLANNWARHKIYRGVLRTFFLSAIPIITIYFLNMQIVIQREDAAKELRVKITPILFDSICYDEDNELGGQLCEPKYPASVRFEALVEYIKIDDDLSFAKLQGLDMSILNGFDFRNVDFSYANLSGTDMSGLDLRCSFFNSVYYDQKSDFSGSDLRGASIHMFSEKYKDSQAKYSAETRFSGWELNTQNIMIYVDNSGLKCGSRMHSSKQDYIDCNPKTIECKIRSN